jgi:hypothetical protein
VARTGVWFMSDANERSMSRRSLLQAAAAGSAVLIGSILTASPARAASSLGMTSSSASSDLGRFTDIAGVHSEYRDAIAAYPLPLPPGWTFPAESQQRDGSVVGQWERGSGQAEAYFYWQRANAVAAYEAYLRGDPTEAERLLDVLAYGYNSPVRKAVLEDPENVFLREALPAARATQLARGAGVDYTRLLLLAAP